MEEDTIKATTKVIEAETLNKRELVMSEEKLDVLPEEKARRARGRSSHHGTKSGDKKHRGKHHDGHKHRHHYKLEKKRKISKELSTENNEKQMAGVAAGAKDAKPARRRHDAPSPLHERLAPSPDIVDMQGIVADIETESSSVGQRQLNSFEEEYTETGQDRGASDGIFDDAENDSVQPSDRQVITIEETPPSPAMNNLSSNDSALPVATKVETPPELLERVRQLEAQHAAVPTATPVDEEEMLRAKRRYRRRVGIMVALTCLVILAIVLGTVFGVRNNNKDSIGIEPTTSPTSSPESVAIQELIESVSLDGGAALQNEASPQSLALEWLVQDSVNRNGTQYEDSRLIQRYALAALYYSTSGDTWRNNAKWLSSEHECEWFTSATIPVCNEGRFLRIGLVDNGLVGAVPREIALLSDSLRKCLLVCTF